MGSERKDWVDRDREKILVARKKKWVKREKIWMENKDIVLLGQSTSP